jgi:hypothetical protein
MAGFQVSTEAERNLVLAPINAGLEAINLSMMTLSQFIDKKYLPIKKFKWRVNGTDIRRYHIPTEAQTGLEERWYRRNQLSGDASYVL